MTSPTSLKRERFRAPALLIAAVAMLGITAEPVSAKMPNIKRKLESTITFALTAPVGTPAPAPTGTATIGLSEDKEGTEALFELETAGLAAGDYVVEATVEGVPPTIAPIGSFTIAATLPTDPVVVANELEVPVPPTIDSLAITTITVSSVDPLTSVKTVVLTGPASVVTSELKFFANVRVTAPPASALVDPPTATGETTKGKGAKAKKVHGHALAKATITAGVQTKRQFLLVAQGAPANAVLNVVIDGVEIQPVTATKNGKVMIQILPETVALEAMDLLTITDAAGVVVMQADFSVE